MASLSDILQRTMLFTAARGAGIDAYAKKLGPTEPIPCPAPAVNPALASEDQPIWQWTHDPAAPAKVSDVKCIMRSMGGMVVPVATKIEVEDVSVVLIPGDEPFSLPLTPDFVIAKFALADGKIVDSAQGWWQLPANVDRSLLVVFGYEVAVSSLPGGAQPLSLDLIEALGSRFFPDPDVPPDDPDALGVLIGPPSPSAPPAKATTNQRVTSFIGPTWVIVAIGLTTCKQRADFEPGGLLGAGRLYPHVMVSCNSALAKAEATISLHRPAKATKMDPEMMDDLGAIFVTDTNDPHTIGGSLVPGLPLWSNFFDYWELNPDTTIGLGKELTFVDASKAFERSVQNGIIREQSLHVPSTYESSSTFRKLPFQGEFDNIHMAPRMRFTSRTTGATISDIAMAPFCEHDCLHTHMRWGSLGLGSLPKPNLGFAGRRPYSTVGAPLVPSNQSVFVSLISKSAMRYRAVANAPLPAGTWTVFNHHGSGYALEIEAVRVVDGIRGMVRKYAETCLEPFVRGFFPNTVMTDFDPTTSFAALYQRLQFTGTDNPDTWIPRVKILDLHACRMK